MYNPINRTTVQVEENKFRVYPKQGPLFYKKSNGELNEIDLTFNDSTSTIGDISLMNKGILSVGKRKDKNPYKITGVRPDNCQTGEKQLEFSVVNIELDDEKQNFDDIEILLSPNSIYQLVKLNKQFSKIKIEFDIHAKGLELVNNKYTEKTTICDYGFNLNNVGQKSGNEMLSIHNSYANLDKEIPYLDFTVGLINDKFITMGQYTESEEFGESNLANYSIYNDMYTHGSAVYYEDAIVFTMHSYNIINFENIILNNLCALYGLEVFDDDGYGKYLTKDNKKVIGYYVKDNVFVGFINTKEISDNIKNLFIRKTFEDTSYLNITLDDFCNDISNAFNKNLKIEVDSSYYEGNSYEFKINNESLYINKPIAFDKNFNELYYFTTHTLTDNNDGSYRYTKYLLPETALNINDATYIDATLSVASETCQLLSGRPLGTDAGIVGFFYSSGRKKTSTNFTAIRNETTGSGFPVGGITTNFGVVGDYGAVRPSSSQFGTTFAYNYTIQKVYFNFDCSSVTDTVDDMDFVMRAKFQSQYTTGNTGGIADHSIILLKGDVGSNIGNDRWNDFTGHTSNWSASDVTEYSGEFVTSDTSYDYRTIPMTSDAKTDLKNLSKLELLVVDYDQYYLNSLNTSWAYNPQGSFTNNVIRSEFRQTIMNDAQTSTTSYRPYIEFTTTTTPTAPTENATFFGANF
mgnify:CR=1 FL=1|tara:strand:+ start:219 stop:2288 length:2070 start_codon:yes stop_codon:yes gene_type:complete